MAIVTSEAILLRKYELRETSFLLDFYTRTNGKIRGVIKGVRSPQPQFGSSFEVCTLDKVVFYERRNKEIYTVSQCELIEYFSGIRKDLEKTSYALYFLELVDATCPAGEVNEGIFDLLLDSLARLADELYPRAFARAFEIRLLKELGMEPRLSQCAGCGSRDVPDGARFSVRSGGVVCGRCESSHAGCISVSDGAMGFVRDVLSECPGRDWPYGPDGCVNEVETLIKNFLNFHIQKRFKSVEFIEQIGI